MAPIDQERAEVPRRLAELERKIDQLTGVLGVQSVLLGVVTLSYLLELTRNLVFILLALLPLMFIFRRRIPALARSIGRIGRFLFGLGRTRWSRAPQDARSGSSRAGGGAILPHSASSLELENFVYAGEKI